jgi:hypothetical protein
METDFQGDLNPQKEEGIQKVEWLERATIPSLFENAYSNIKLLWEKSDL